MVDVVEVLTEELSVSTGTGDITLSSKNARRTFNESMVQEVQISSSIL